MARRMAMEEERLARSQALEAERMARSEVMEAERGARNAALEAERSARIEAMQAERISRTQAFEAERIARCQALEAERIMRIQEMEVERIARAQESSYDVNILNNQGVLFQNYSYQPTQGTNIVHANNIIYASPLFPIGLCETNPPLMADQREEQKPDSVPKTPTTQKRHSKAPQNEQINEKAVCQI